ncbi:sulfate permease [Methylacidiphilales bacterium]|nr:sulfate permease [Candidatus Methylacidiphilales bacterium]
MIWDIQFRPKLIECLKDYNGRKFFADLIAGITVGIVALPLAMAFGIASGVAPQAGIFTAVIAGFLISALGGSRVQIGGPTGAFIVIVYGIVMQYGLQNLIICTVMAGVILVIMGLSRMGTVIKYIPLPVTLGFTNGIAVLIFTTQIKDFFGLKMDAVPAEFVAKMTALFESFPSLNYPTVGVAVASLSIILFWPKKWGKIVPGSIVALIAGTVAVTFFRLPVETIGSRFGAIPQGLPPFHFPQVSWNTIQHLVAPATTIALLAAIESLLSAVVADGMIDDRHDSNQELMAQGIANIVCPFFGGIPATGAIARTATNIRNGAVSPVSGIIHSLTLLFILLVAAPLAKFIPLATLSAVLMLVAYNMGEWREFSLLGKYPKSDASVFLTTFGLTVVFDLTVAVEIGMVLASILFIRRISETTQVSLVDEETETEGDHHSLRGKTVPAGVLIFNVFGALMFGAAEKLDSIFQRSQQDPDVLILRMQKVLAMDSTALHILENLHQKLRAHGKYLILSGPHTQPYFIMEKSGFLDKLGHEQVAVDIDDALRKAQVLLDRKRQ